MGVNATVDQAAPTKFPYNFCLTNICIAADHVSPKLIGEMESGQTLKIELSDFNSSSGRDELSSQPVRRGSQRPASRDLRL